MEKPAVSVERRANGVAVVRVDSPPVNALSKPVREGLLAAFSALAFDETVSAVVLTGTAGRFVAGADIKEMSAAPEPPFLPDIVAAIEECGTPVLAAIDGAALGGGLELALACDGRIGSPTASVGLPEVRLGIVPGAGGTQRLPRLVGIVKAIGMIAGATVLKAKEAEAAGLLDALAEDPVEAAILAAPSAKKRVLSRLAPTGGEPADEDAAASAALKRAKNAPSAREAVRLVRAARTASFADGLADERRTFLRLRDGEEAGALRHLFLAEREAAKVPGLEGVAARRIERAAVIGAGTMGVGIAAALLDAGLPVAIIERDDEAARAGHDRLRELYRRQIESGRLPAADADARLARASLSADWGTLTDADLIIEAAFEELGVKEDVFRRLDQVARPGALLATNTSYLDVDRIASATKRPGDVLGLHFFAPANVMRLLEVVRGGQTENDALATALALAKRLGKQPVVAGNADGFIGNRIYASYRRAAEHLVEDGASPYAVDRALEDYGFAMGVFAVSDLSGLDIGHAMRRRRDATRHTAERYVAVADRLFEAGRLGRKSGRGWYGYRSGKAEPDPEVEAIVAAERRAKGIAPRDFTPEAIVCRLLAAMANEGAKALEEGVAERASDIDVVFANGYGFPRAKGGPMWAADRAGLPAVLTEVEAGFQAGGAGSEPAALLVDLARSGGRFADWRG